MSRNYIKSLDGVRALAVTSVILFHFDQNLLPGGYLGVDIFFVLSGYLMAQIVLSRSDVSALDSLLATLARRFSRLLPGLFLCVMTTAVATAALIPSAKDALKTGKNALFGASNIRLLAKARDYFGSDSALDPFTHTWSLSVEWQFYLVFLPCSFLVFSSRLSMGLAALFAGSISLIAFVLFAGSAPDATFYLPFTRFWEFAAGALVACVPLYIKLPRPIVETAHFFFLCTIAVALGFPDLIGYLNVVTVVGSSALFLLVARERTLTTTMLTIPIVRWIGDLSYSLYLWHWPVIVLAVWLDIFSPATWLPLIACIFALSVGSYYGFEKPIRAFARGKSPTLVLTTGSGTILAAVVLLTIVPSKQFYIRHHQPTTLGPVHNELDCHLPVGPSPMEACLTRTNLNQKHVFVVGDSHAGNLVPSIDQVGQKHGFALRYLTDRALSFDMLGWESCGGTVCAVDESRTRLEFLLREAQPGDVVIFALARDKLLKEPFNGSARLTSVRNKEQAYLSRSLENWTRQLTDAGIHFLVVDDIPKLCSEKDFAISHATGAFERCTVSLPHSIEDRQALTAAYEGAIKAGAFYLDPHNEFCDSEYCAVLSANGQILYSDSSPHFNKYAPTPLIDFFEREFLNIPGLINQ
ncbi:peptidoglycan/LPS O-acetylase OafA/YrhL [Labrenzia sp. EL_126]|nr:peptidoglycan/LPS O-acetylase OafA/YrhL [Labrenzia sp. EL_126]